MKLIIGKYQGTIYPEGNGYTGAIDLGANVKGGRNRLKRKGRTKEIVKDKLRKAVSELEAGIETSDTYTVEAAVRDWLARGTKGLSAKTINDYRSLADSNLIPFIGAYTLKELTADNVDDWLEQSSGRTCRAAHPATAPTRPPGATIRQRSRSPGNPLEVWRLPLTGFL